MLFLLNLRFVELDFSALRPLFKVKSAPLLPEFRFTSNPSSRSTFVYAFFHPSRLSLTFPFSRFSSLGALSLCSGPPILPPRLLLKGSRLIRVYFFYVSFVQTVFCYFYSVGRSPPASVFRSVSIRISDLVPVLRSLRYQGLSFTTLVVFSLFSQPPS